MTKAPLTPQPSAAPTRKVAFTAIAGAAFTALVWVADYFYGIEIPGEVQGAIHTALGAAIGYLVHDRMNS